MEALSGATADDPILINLNLQKACLKLAKEGNTADKKSLINCLEEVDQSLHQETKLKTCHKTSEFARDVKGLLETLKKETETGQKKRVLKAVFTDDPIDLLLCGTDVSGSCQRLDGTPNLNKGLLGYLIDGKNRLLAIKEGDKIVARCMLALLWDGKKPVLYRERFYPDQIPEAQKQALNVLAKQVAQKLGLPLTCGEGHIPYQSILQALGGPAPYEYSDGAVGIQKEGRFTIKAKKLQ